MWDTFNKYWIGSVLDATTLHVNDWFKKKNIIFQQYTGLKDKNGKEIYEGDYIKNSDGLIMSVKWNQSRCCFAASVSTADGWMNLLEDLIKDFEVIGNIFENSDLLTK
jgi:uncharacterized phage protein (TIGR01671 family)